MGGRLGADRDDPPRMCGKAVGTMQSGWAVGWGVANLLYLLLYSVLPEQLAWRALFWAGIFPALLVLYIRRNVQEPEVYSATRTKAKERGSHFLEIFSPALLNTAITSLMITGMMAGYFAVFFWLPDLPGQTQRGLSVLNTGFYTFVVIAGSFVGYLAAAYASDLLGRKKTFFLFAAGSALIAILYTQIPINNTLMLFLGFPLGFFVSGNFSGCGPFLTELYPSRVRGSGRIRLQLRARDEVAFADAAGRLSQQHDHAGQGHRHGGYRRLRRGDSGGGALARNPR